MPETKMKTLHFSIEGEWFTWLLRHLWVEGNEIKAIRMWEASFPEYTTVEYLKRFFIDIVSGRKKFIGQNSFTLVKDDVKYWSTTAGAKPNKAFPLLDSFEDVILLKRAKMYLVEIDLRAFRLNRRYGETHKDVDNNSLKWLSAAQENKVENDLRNKANEYYTSIRNLSRMFGNDLTFELIPDKTERLDTKAFYSKGRGFKETGDTGIVEGSNLFYEIMKTITPFKTYFEKKYGYDMLFISEERIREICGCSSEKVKYYNRMKDIPTEEEINNRIQSIIPGLDLDKYIKQSIKESHREKIEIEDVKTTEYTSGYIDKEGNFYGCADIDHRNFSNDLCKLLDVSGCDKEEFDAQIYLDKLGYIKVSVNRFYWDQNIELSQAQKDTIYDYVKAKNIIKTQFNTFGAHITYEEAFLKERNENV